MEREDGEVGGVWQGLAWMCPPSAQPCLPGPRQDRQPGRGYYGAQSHSPRQMAGPLPVIFLHNAFSSKMSTCEDASLR